MKNNIKYNKNDVIQQFNELKNEISFLTFENFKMFLQIKNIRNLSNYEKYYDIFSCNYKEYIKNNGGYFYTAYHDKEIIGVLYINKNNYIDSLFIKEEFQNHQIGSNLLKQCIIDYIGNEITLSCLENSLEFYKKLGFTENSYSNNKKIYQLVYKNDKNISF